MPAEHDVFENCHRAEQRQILKSPADAERCHAVDGRGRQTTAVKNDFALPQLVQPGETIEQCGLARPIGTDQPADLPAPDVEADAVERDDAAKSHCHIFDGKKHRSVRGVAA